VDNEKKIKVRYYLAEGSGETSNNAAGNLVVVSVEDYRVFSIAPVFRTAKPWSLTVSAVDKVEPFPGVPPARE
jgi:hypothetical protein